MSTRERLSMGRRNVRVGGKEWASRGAAMGARKRLPVG
mgnify:FL=1